MNRLLLSTALAGLLSAGAAFAQDDHHGHAPAGHGGGGAPHAAPAGHAGGPGPGNHGAPHPVAGGAVGHDYHPGAAPGGAPAMQMHRDTRDGGPRSGGAMTGPAPGAAMRGPGPGAARRGPGHAGNFNAYHRNFTAPRQFHIGSYNRPSGWYAHRWTYGEILPSLFWSQNYWIGDFSDYGLMPPPPGTIWVRDGADALLIDQDNGEVIQVEYGVFY
jgi:Ni/Co efflux regulator RcnB